MSYMSPFICLHLSQSVHVVIPGGAVATMVLLQETREGGDRCAGEYAVRLTKQLRVGDTVRGLCMWTLVGTTFPPLQK